MIELRGLSYAIGDFRLQKVDLQVGAGEYFVLLGRPGSGKTLLVECIAGLRRLTGGQIRLSGRPVDRLEPARRGVGYVPQDYALFSRRTVRGNIEFGLRLRRAPASERERRVRDLARLLGLEALLERSTRGLSGGERQRVALARALAPEPHTLLLDEPVSALDFDTREEILGELRRIQRETGTTTVHVCHDLDEMRAVADRVAVLDTGRLAQVGTPEELAQTPASAVVARLLRLGTVLQGVAHSSTAGTHVDLGDLSVDAEGDRRGPVEVLLRAGGISVGSDAGDHGLTARVQSVVSGGSHVHLRLAVGETALRVDLHLPAERSLALEPGTEVRVAIPTEAVYILPAAGS